MRTTTTTHGHRLPRLCGSRGGGGGGCSVCSGASIRGVARLVFSGISIRLLFVHSFWCEGQIRRYHEA
jgi:hypothetical protein